MADSLTTSALVDRLTGLGEDKWAVHFEARRRIANGDDVIELTIGEPDIPVSSALIDVAEQAMRAGRTRASASLRSLRGYLTGSYGAGAENGRLSAVW